MTHKDTEQLAAILLDARAAGTPIPVGQCPVATTAQAYAIQDACARRGAWFAAGPRAWKVGAPNRAQVPTAAPLPDAGLLASPAHLGPTPMVRLGIEAELGFRLSRDLAAPLPLDWDSADAAEWLDAVFVTIEVVDCRFTEGEATPGPHKLADLQSHGALVIGEPAAFTPLDWSTLHCLVKLNGRITAEAVGTHPLGDPLWAMPWLIEHARQRYGGLRKADLITTGAWTGIMPVSPGDRVEVAFERIGQASIEFSTF
ncbi:MAG: fumarylacetoacetate hydrolase family protein [Quisquiliibacterium sp.]